MPVTHSLRFIADNQLLPYSLSNYDVEFTQHNSQLHMYIGNYKKMLWVIY